MSTATVDFCAAMADRRLAQRTASLQPRFNPALTVVIPAYNEEQRLPATLTGLRDFLDDWGIDYRVLVVDDGSQDNTAYIAEFFGDRFSTVVQPRQRGKGAAVRLGMLRAAGSIIAFTDADLPYELEALRAAYELIVAGDAAVVCGARNVTGSLVRARRRWIRTAASQVFRGCMRWLVSREVTDTQCGLKVFSAAAAREIFSRTTIEGFAFDAEVVYLARHLGFTLQPVPVTLINEYASTLSLWRHAVPMLADVLGIHWRAWQGQYSLGHGERSVVSPSLDEDAVRAAA